MAFTNMGTNHGSTLNSHINFIISQGIHSYSSYVWRKTQANLIFGKVTTSLANLKKKFENKSKEECEIVYFSKQTTINPSNTQCLYEHSLSDVNLLPPHPILMLNMKKRKSNRCAHLFNQIHTFRTGRHIKKEGPSVIPKDFFKIGLLQSKSKLQVKNDLNGFFASRTEPEGLISLC
jgi:hypothetical protein